MGYKILGFLVWRGARWYVRRRVSERRGRVVFLGLAALAVAGVVAAGRSSSRPA